MDMLSYLTVLIKTRKEVGIPGLGTIYKKKSPGRYDAATHSFLPPSFVLDFNPELLEQSLLIDHICKHRNISPDSASYFVEQFVGEIKKQLDEHQEASLAPLGTLYQSSGTLSFKPLNDQNFGFDFYGLPPVKDELSAAPVSEAVSATVTTSETEPQQEELPKTEDRQPTEEQLELENSNADLREEPLNPPIIEEVAEEEALSDEEVLLNEGAEDIAYEQITDPIELSVNPEIPVTAEAPVTPEKVLLSEQDEQPVFEEIAEVEAPKQPVAQPEIESIGNIEEQPKAVFEEPVVTRPSINDIYAQASKTVDVPIIPVVPKISGNEGFYNSNDEPEERTGIPVYLKILIAVLLILIGLVAGYFIRPDLFDSILKMGKDPIVVPVTAKNSVQTADSLASADSMNNTLALNDTLKKDTLASTETTVTNDPKAALANAPVQETGITYEVIGASVANEKEAERFIAQMKKLGLNAKAIPPIPGKKKIKISIATFNDYNSADAEKPVLEKKLGIKDLYIHTNKPL
ncbi:SPOR domain-containing protein [Pedobacter gandavensis]|uniref:HU domain-containing protein n=1 Tax=Pedobacter gandavensis TaxID=2679963 RepID=UPI00292CAD26|nr:SPOR domain-containing protein [Pedobacter gandavensis]